MKRPQLLEIGKSRLSKLEKFQIGLVQQSLDRPWFDRTLRFLQVHIGSRWISAAIHRLLQLHHVERVQELGSEQSFIIVANHRSFFDLYVVTGSLVRRGLRQRILFPVRANFFYDNLAGLFVNGAMSFFAMYPPIFRERKKLILSLAAMDELAYLLRRSPTVVGIHPEGQRNAGDPYQLLPLKPGVGRMAYLAQVPVIPVFVNGLEPSDIKKQIASNWSQDGKKIHVLFGEAIALDDLYQGPENAESYAAITKRIELAISALGQEEKQIREADGEVLESFGDS